MTIIQNQSGSLITTVFLISWVGTKWSYLTAFIVVTMIPVALVFISMEKYIISGFNSVAMKG
jgi:multiple sugar transport system permease protein